MTSGYSSGSTKSVAELSYNSTSISLVTFLSPWHSRIPSILVELISSPMAEEFGVNVIGIRQSTGAGRSVDCCKALPNYVSVPGFSLELPDFYFYNE